VFRLPAFEFLSQQQANAGNFVVDFGSADRSRLTDHIAMIVLQGCCAAAVAPSGMCGAIEYAACQATS
jgi:hypothetical protein